MQPTKDYDKKLSTENKLFNRMIPPKIEMTGFIWLTFHLVFSVALHLWNWYIIPCILSLLWCVYSLMLLLTCSSIHSIQTLPTRWTRFTLMSFDSTWTLESRETWDTWNTIPCSITRFSFWSFKTCNIMLFMF